MAHIATPISPGQFDDAEEDGTRYMYRNRGGVAYLDDDYASDMDSWGIPDYDDENDDAYDGDRVEDEDWENAERDFTKQYNRLQQHASVRAGNTHMPLPAMNHPKSASTATSASNSLTKISISDAKQRTTTQLASLSKYNSRLAKIDVPYVMGVGVNRKGPSAHANLKDKSDRATNEQVLDPRTRLILFKMIGRELIQEVNGCVSTGKEANVYHALRPDASHLALKIYKTSILIFKDRDKYVTGEYRFRRGYSKNPRKMVRLWAEKEMRNLKRLIAAGIRAPDPIEVRENVLVMTFVGDKNGWASPRLKDASLPPEAIGALYEELVLTVRRMFHVCKLVHADLSEYNIMYHEEHLWIIDVSQSVEHDHPAAFDFLRKDIKNIEDFFGRLGVTCLGLRRCFEFVTKEKLMEEEGDSDEDVFKKMQANREEENQEQWVTAKGDGGGDNHPSNLDSTNQKLNSEDAAHEDSVFLHSFIPRNLNEVYDPERDLEKHKRGDELIYADSIGLLPLDEKCRVLGGEAETFVVLETIDLPSLPNAKVRFEGQTLAEDQAELNEDGGEDNDSREDADSDNEKNPFVEKKPRGHRHEDKEAKKERKKMTKAEAKEKRQNKMPKAEKKRIIKKTKS